MADALAIRTEKERALEDRRNKYALGALRHEKLHINVAIRTLWPLGDLLAQIEQHGANVAPDPAVFYQDLRSLRLNLQLNCPTFEIIAPARMAATLPTAHSCPQRVHTPGRRPTPPQTPTRPGVFYFLREPAAPAAAGVIPRRSAYWAPHSKRSRFSDRSEKRCPLGQVMV